MSQYKLKMAAAEIRDICVKHDIAASILLADPDNGERLQVLDTTILETLGERFDLRNWIKNIDRKETRK